MDRRTFVSTAIALSVSAIAGCTSEPAANETVTTSAGGSPTATGASTATEEPTATPSGDRHPAAQVAYEFYVAFLEGNFDAANDLVHPNHRDEDWFPVTEEKVGDTEGVEIIGAQSAETDGEVAYSEVEIDDNGSSFKKVITLRTHEGEWMVWSSQDCRSYPC